MRCACGVFLLTRIELLAIFCLALQVKKQSVHDQSCQLFPDNRPHPDILCGDAHHSVCPHHHGQTAHPAYHWHGARRSSSRQVRLQHPCARRLVRAVRQGRTLLHHVSRLAGDGHGGREAQQGPLPRIRSADVRAAARADILRQHIPAALLRVRVAALGLPHGVEHAHRLPHRGPLRSAAQAERDALGRFVDDFAAHGACGAYSHRRLVRRRDERVVLAAVRGQVRGLLRRDVPAHSALHALVPAPLQRRRHAVHLRDVDALHECGGERSRRS